MDLGASNVSLISKDLRFPVESLKARGAARRADLSGRSRVTDLISVTSLPQQGGVCPCSGLQHLQVDALLSLSL